MSLRVWLPLTKDLRNQGLDDVTVTNHGATFNSAGKLGGTCNFNGSSNYLTVSKGYFGANYSYSLWFYTTSISATQNLGCCRNSVGEGFSIFLISGKIRIDGGGTGDATQWVTNYTFSANTWTHLTVTCANGVLKFYINGVYQGTKTITLTSSKWGTIYSVGASQSNGSGYGNFLGGKLNDVRIYDHCLSPMEVKQLSQGLVLHYPLSDRFLEGTTNLVTSITSGGQTTWANNILTTSGTNADTYFTINLSESIVNGTQYTISCDAEDIPQGTCWTFPLGQQSNTALSFQIYNGHNEYTFTANNISWGTKRCFMDDGGSPNSARATGAQCKIYNFQIEKKDHATGFAGYGGTRNSNTVYDCSGFCNNGTISGNLTISNDTPKYSVSTQFNGTQHIQAPFSCNVISEAVSVAVWGYESNWNTSSAERLIGAATNSSGWCIGDYGSENTLFAFYANGGYNAATGFKQLSAGWHHFVITFDGLHLNYYVDGQSFSSKTFSTKQTATGNYNIEIGRHYGDSCNFKGRMSDVRIYATALSASDVKSLYQNSAYIDSSGNVYGAVHSEV